MSEVCPCTCMVHKIIYSIIHRHWNYYYNECFSLLVTTDGNFVIIIIIIIIISEIVTS